MKKFIASLLLAMSLGIVRVAKASTFVSSTVDRTMSGSFESKDATGCVITRVDVSAHYSNAAGYSTALLFIHKQDLCKNLALLDAQWFGVLPAGAFTWVEHTFYTNLISYKLVTKQTFTDEITLKPIVISTNVTFTGVGNETRTFSATDNDLTLTFGYYRNAVGTGTVTDGATNYSPKSTPIGFLQRITVNRYQ